MNSKIILSLLCFSSFILFVQSSFVTPELACDIRKDLHKREDAVHCVLKNADKAGPGVASVVKGCDAKYDLLKDKVSTLQRLCDEHSREVGFIADCLVNSINPILVNQDEARKYTEEVAVECFKDLK